MPKIIQGKKRAKSRIERLEELTGKGKPEWVKEKKKNKGKKKNKRKS